jgi:hypothetical protein
MIALDGKFIIFGGMNKQPNTFEIFQDDQWEPLEGVTFQD